ncbi:hypothetical protein GF325_15380 [Candidatus Bathyarchaeota archaeon]|nr:hypothetical protein [Candidatus Bathyarchaeota archaeon]
MKYYTCFSNPPTMTSMLAFVGYNILLVGMVYGAIIFQKLGAIQTPKFGEEKHGTVLKGFLKNKTWLIGIGLNALTIPYSMFLFSITSLSFIMVFQRAGIIIIFIFSIKCLDEEMTRLELIGLIILYSGFFLVIFLIEPETTSFNNDIGAIVYFIVATLTFAFCFLTFNKVKPGKAREVILATGAGLSGVAGTIALKIIPMVLSRDLGASNYIFNLFNFPELGRIMIGVFQPGSSYFFGSLYFYIWLGSFTANFFLLMIMYQHGRAVITIPIMNNLNFMISIVFGYFVFNEPLNAISWIGILIMVFGILLTSRSETKLIEAEKAAMVKDQAQNVIPTKETEEEEELHEG